MSRSDQSATNRLRMQVVHVGPPGVPLHLPRKLSAQNAECTVRVDCSWSSKRADLVVFADLTAPDVRGRVGWIFRQLAAAAPGAIAFAGDAIGVRIDSKWNQTLGSPLARTQAGEVAGQTRSLSEQILHQWSTKSQSLAAAMRQLDSLIDPWPRILIVGETGTGKTRLAKVIHRCLPHTDKERLVVISPAIASASTASSEIFGHRRGAFTGAEFDREGRCQKATGGTILLDDIDVYPLSVQASLLRLVDEGVFQKVGDEVEQKVECVIIATASNELEKLVREGKFRRDLYERLRGLVLDLPPLRARPEDIPHYAALYLRERFGLNDRAVGNILGKEAVARLVEHRWIGNVRELQHVMERLVRSVGGRTMVTRKHVDSAIKAVSVKSKKKTEVVDLSKLDEYPIRVSQANDLASAQMLLAALTKFEGNVSKASEQLKVSRSYLYRLMARYGINVDDFRPDWTRSGQTPSSEGE